MSRIERVRASLRKGGAVFIRSAEPSDVGALRDFESHMLANNPFGVREPGEAQRTEQEDRQRIERFVREPGWLMLTAWTANRHEELVGELSFRAGERRKLAHHGSFGLSVHAAWRGRGVGSAMIHALLAWAAAHRQIEKVTLGVFETNTEARRLYERLGFVEESRALRYFKIGPGRYVDDVQMAIYVKPGVAPAGFKTWPIVEAKGRGGKGAVGGAAGGAAGGGAAKGAGPSGQAAVSGSGGPPTGAVSGSATSVPPVAPSVPTPAGGA
ncbi:MAG: GNAT family N-acetyltransferase [Phycisphaerae bacterium]|nr:GNAT family N-acetyltransferase [Phycisphaerae bacterium]